MFDCDYKIYDNYKKKWYGISFAEFEDAKDHVIYVLGDADLKRYSIYKRMDGQ